jgi:membrane-bound lytic murein transglycosylase D
VGFNRPGWALLMSLALFFLGCRSMGDFGPPGGAESRTAGDETPADSAPLLTSPPSKKAKDEEERQADQDPSPARCGPAAVESRPENTPHEQVSEDQPQELLDSAIEHCQSSGELWERGDFEGTIRELDKAYFLILQMDVDDDPELLQQREDVRFTISKRILEAYTSGLNAAQGSSHEIPLAMNDHVRKALRSFQGREREFFLSAYRRSGKYRPGIVKALHEAGLPEELSWLPLIESGFKVRALSRARALGLWQFIASTGYKYGLTRDRWIDERMDPEKSTRAAIAYLTELHQMFGDWSTVLAAYNCGEWAVLNCIKKQRINYLDNFWDLYKRLPQETASYVPRFLAVLHILKDPEAYGFELPPLEEPMETDEVTIGKQVHLKNIAQRLDVEYGILKELNPELRQNFTPDSPYAFKVPSGKGEILLAKLDDIPAWRPSVPSYSVHRVRKGESLSVLASRYGSSVRAIMHANGLKTSNILRVGQKLRIPGKGTAGGWDEKPVIQTAKIGRRLSTYVVKRGDSLWEIAGAYGTTTHTIISLNGLRSSRLRVGQVLKVPKGAGSSASRKAAVYRVRRGDSPYWVARRHQMNVSELLRLNHLTPSCTIYPGQTLLVSEQ